MKTHLFLYLSCIIFAVAMQSCGKKITVAPNDAPPTLNRIEGEPLPEFQTPVFPAVALHLIYREFLDQNPSITTVAQLDGSNFDAYLEERLIDLYPEDAYTGIVEDAQEEYILYSEDYQTFISNNNMTDTLEDGVPTNLPTLASETNYLDMDNDEITKWNNLESLIDNRLVTRAEIDSVVLEGLSKTTAGPIDYLALTSATAPAYALWRVLQAKARTEGMTGQFYPGNNSGGKKGDAFRHIYMSMQLRRYITQAGANAVMTTYEWIKINKCRDRYMDYHNNVIGRNTQYNTFRYGNNATANDWGKWAQNVKSFVDNNSNASYQSSWQSNHTFPTNCSGIEGEEDNISNILYIYYQ